MGKTSKTRDVGDSESKLSISGCIQKHSLSNPQWLILHLIVDTYSIYMDKEGKPFPVYAHTLNSLARNVESTIAQLAFRLVDWEINFSQKNVKVRILKILSQLETKGYIASKPANEVATPTPLGELPPASAANQAFFFQEDFKKSQLAPNMTAYVPTSLGILAMMLAAADPFDYSPPRMALKFSWLVGRKAGLIRDFAKLLCDEEKLDMSHSKVAQYFDPKSNLTVRLDLVKATIDCLQKIRSVCSKYGKAEPAPNEFVNEIMEPIIGLSMLSKIERADLISFSMGIILRAYREALGGPSAIDVHISIWRSVEFQLEEMMKLVTRSERT